MRELKLGDIANIITGPFGSQLHMEDYVNEGIPVVMPQNIKERKVDEKGIARISEYDYVRLKKYATMKNDIVYARRGDIEKHAFIENDNKMLCGTGCLRIRVKDSDVLPLYLSFYLCSPEARKGLVSHAIGTNMQNLNTGILSEVPVKLPPYEKQAIIADFLHKLESKIELNQKINDYLHQMAYAEYMHMFYGKTPNTKLGNVIIEHPRSSVQVGEAKKQFGNIPFFTSGDAIYRWTESFVSDRSIFLNTGGNADVKFYVGNAAYSTDTWCISGKNNLSDYVYLMLKSIKLELDQKFFQGTGLKHLQKPLLKDRLIYVPTNVELDTFNADIQPWLSMVSDNIRESEELTALRDWLLPMLMNGQVIISD